MVKRIFQSVGVLVLLGIVVIAVSVVRFDKTKEELLPKYTTAASQFIALPDGAELVETPFGGVVWKLMKTPGDIVAAGETIAVMEAMKTEFPVESPAAGTVAAIYVAERQSLTPGAPMLALIRG